MTDPKTQSSSRPFLMILGATILVAVGLLLLPPDLQRALFGLILFAGVAIGIRRLFNALPESDTSIDPETTEQSAQPMLILIGVTVIIAVLLLMLPMMLQRLLFGLIMLIWLGLGLRYFGSPISRTTQRLWVYYRTYPKRVAQVSAVIVVGLMCASAYFYQPQYSTRFYGFYLFVLSLLFVPLARPVFASVIAGNNMITRSSPDKIRRWSLGISFVAFALLMASNLPGKHENIIHETLWLHQTHPAIQMSFLGIGLLSLIHGVGARILPRRFKWQRHHTLLLVIILAGGVIRAWDLENTYHLFVDEFTFIRDIIMLQERTLPILIPNSAPNTDVYSFFQLIFVELMGPSLTSMRIASAITAMGGLYVVYLFARQLFTLRVALVSTVLFATMPVYIQFGRIGLNNIVDPIFGMLAFTYLIRAMRSGKLSDYAMAGVTLGLTHYFYEGGRLFFTAFVICWFIWMMIFCRRDPLFRPPTRRQLSVFLFCLVMMMAPIYHTLWQYDHPWAQRLGATQDYEFSFDDKVEEFFEVGEVGEIGWALHRYVFREAYDNFYQSEYAYVIPILAPFFLLGFGMMLWRIRTVRGSLLIWWLIGVAIGNSLIVDTLSAASPRYIVVYGALMVITAVGIVTIWQTLSARVNARRQKVIRWAFIAYIGFVGAYQVHHYIFTVVPNFYEKTYSRVLSTGRVRPAYDDMILRAAKLPDNTSVQVFTKAIMPVTHLRDIPRFYNRHRDYFDVDFQQVRELDNSYFEALPRDMDYVFVFTRRDQAKVMDWIDNHFIVTRIEGSHHDIPEKAEMLFAYASGEDNPPRENAPDMPFERAPTGKWAPGAGG